MSRGKLVPPNLDDRTWQQLVDQARALIPALAPEWTDHSPSDPGIALLELFAWLTEGLTYRLNRVPERHVLEFMSLVGVTRRPATPASTYLTFRLAPGASRITVPKGSWVATRETESAEAAEATVFETDEPVLVLPINLTTALFSKKRMARRHIFEDCSAALIDTPLTGLTLQIAQNQGNAIFLGFDFPGFTAATTEITPITLACGLTKPITIVDSDHHEAIVTWHYPQGRPALPDAWPELAPVVDSTNGLRQDGIVRIEVPSGWIRQKLVDWAPEIHWLALKIYHSVDASDFDEEPLEFELGHILFNSASATNALTVENELLGVSNGKPFQYFHLGHRPVFKQPGQGDPYEHLKVEVREPSGSRGGFTGWRPWERVVELPAGDKPCYRLDPVTGTIYLGNCDGAAGHGRTPPLDSEFRATYRYVAGGAAGNLQPNTITDAQDVRVQSVTNLAPATGGADEEPLAEVKRRAPEVLRQRYRAITAEDYEHFAREASPAVKKVRCLPPRLFTQAEVEPRSPVPGVKAGDPWTYGSLNRSANCVNVIIVSDEEPTDPRSIRSVELRQQVSDYLEERRALTSLLHVTGPRYLAINVSVVVKVWPEAIDSGRVSGLDSVRNDVTTKIPEFLHPLTGGVEGNGWEIGQSFNIGGLLAYIQLPTEIGYIESVTANPTPVYDPPTRPVGMVDSGAFVPVADYELICSGTHNVTASLAT